MEGKAMPQEESVLRLGRDEALNALSLAAPAGFARPTDAGAGKAAVSRPPIDLRGCHFTCIARRRLDRDGDARHGGTCHP